MKFIISEVKNVFHENGECNKCHIHDTFFFLLQTV